ncbi:MAG: ATP-binding protein [bacterium]|nr:ATP-binding protein [bacterium]
MTIKTKQVISIAILLAGSGVIISTVFITAKSTNRITNLSQDVNWVARNTYDLKILADEYLLYGENRPIVQWTALLKTIRDKFDEFNLYTKEPARLADQTRRNLLVLNALFEELIQLRAQKALIKNNAVPSELENRLEQRLSLLTRHIANNTFRIAQLLEQERNTVRMTGDKTIMITIILIGGFMILFSVFVARTVLNSLNVLAKGTKEFSQGNINYRVNLKNGDEFGDLARSFNEMAANLKTSYVRLEQAKAQDEAILSAIGDGLVAVDKKGKILFVNRSFETLTGWSEKEVMGKQMVDVMPREDETGDPILQERILLRVLTGSSSFPPSPITSYYIRKDKTKFPVAAIVSPVIIDEKIIGAVEVFRDITKEKELDRSKSDFLALASHQLHTPLSGTKWLLETIQRGVVGKTTKKQKEYFDQIYQINERMIRLTSEMLKVLTLESGNQTIKREEISVFKLCEELMRMMELAAQAKGITLHNALKKHKTLFVETDLQILRIILEAFLSNAINYSKSGQEVIFDVKEETNAVVFFVKDRGIGIPEHEQKEIFERFYRASNAKTLKPDGTGLGLYIATLLSKKIGAAILFESEENKGSTFYLRVPKKVDSSEILKK